MSRKAGLNSWNFTAIIASLEFIRCHNLFYIPIKYILKTKRKCFELCCNKILTKQCQLSWTIPKLYRTLLLKRSQMVWTHWIWHQCINADLIPCLPAVWLDGIAVDYISLASMLTTLCFPLHPSKTFPHWTVLCVSVLRQYCEAPLQHCTSVHSGHYREM